MSRKLGHNPSDMDTKRSTHPSGPTGKPITSGFTHTAFLCEHANGKQRIIAVREYAKWYQDAKGFRYNKVDGECISNFSYLYAVRTA